MVKKDNNHEHNCWCCNSTARFPSMAVLVLIFAIVWFLNELQIITINIPWLPVILIVIAIGMIANRYKK